MPGDLAKTSSDATLRAHALPVHAGDVPFYPYPPQPLRKLGNPGALGFFCFASTSLMLSLYDIQTRNIINPNVIVGMGLWCGGIAQILAGMWDFARCNVFGATAFVMYGTFWLSYSTILIPGSGIQQAYVNSPAELHSAVGIYLIIWAIFTFILCVVSFGKNWAFILLLGLLTVELIVLAAGEFGANTTLTKAGGIMGVVVAFLSYWIAVSELLEAEENPPFRLPIGIIRKRWPAADRKV